MCIGLVAASLEPSQSVLVPSASATALQRACRTVGPVGRRSFVEGMGHHNTSAPHHLFCSSKFRPESDCQASSNHSPSSAIAASRPLADDTDPTPHTYCRPALEDRSCSDSAFLDKLRCLLERSGSCAAG